MSDNKNNNQVSDDEEDPTLELEPLSFEACARLISTQDSAAESDSSTEPNEAIVRAVDSETSTPSDYQSDIRELQDALTFRDEMNTILQLGIDQQRERCRSLEEQLSSLKHTNAAITEELEMRRKQVTDLEGRLESTSQREDALRTALESAGETDKSNATVADQGRIIERLERQNLHLAGTISDLEEALASAKSEPSHPESSPRYADEARTDVRRELNPPAAYADETQRESRGVLVSMDDEQLGRYPLGDGIVTVGSGSGSNIRIHSHFISRRHAQFVNTKKGCVVGDLNSTNGTYVNSRRITRRVLRAGDIVTIGKNRFRYQERSASSTSHDRSDHDYGTSSHTH